MQQKEASRVVLLLLCVVAFGDEHQPHMKQSTKHHVRLLYVFVAADDERVAGSTLITGASSSCRMARGQHVEVDVLGLCAELQVRGFFRGLSSPLIGGAAETGVNYLVYSRVLDMFRPPSNLQQQQQLQATSSNCQLLPPLAQAVAAQQHQLARQVQHGHQLHHVQHQQQWHKQQC